MFILSAICFLFLYIYYCKYTHIFVCVFFVGVVAHCLGVGDEKPCFMLHTFEKGKKLGEIFLKKDQIVIVGSFVLF